MYLDQINAETSRLIIAHAQQHASKLIILCFCAQWCGTCRTYQTNIQRLVKLHPDQIYYWIDIEEQATISEIYDVENFPSVAIYTAQGLPYFIGTILPHETHLERLIQTTLDQITTQQPPRLTVEDSHIATTIYRVLTAQK
jgi:thioredoxin 1